MSFQIQREDGSWAEIAGAVDDHIQLAPPIRSSTIPPWTPRKVQVLSAEFSASPELLDALRQQVAPEIRLQHPGGKWAEGPITKLESVRLPDGSLGVSVQIDVLRRSDDSDIINP